MKWSEEQVVYETSGDSPCSCGWIESVYGNGDGTYRLVVYENRVDDLEDATEDDIINEENQVPPERVCDLLVGEDEEDHAELGSDHRERLDGVLSAAIIENDAKLVSAVEHEIKLLDDELKMREE
jgi:hypothetical protein